MGVIFRFIPYLFLLGGIALSYMSRKSKKQRTYQHTSQASQLQALSNDADSLLEALKHPDWRIREAAIWSLAESLDPKIIPYMVGMLNDADNDVREAASNILIAFGEESLHYLLDILNHGDNVIARETAAKALSIMADRASVNSLIEALNDTSVWVRIPVVQALGEIGDPQAVPALIKALRDHDIEVRKHAIEALEKIGTPEALSALTGDA